MTCKGCFETSSVLEESHWSAPMVAPPALSAPFVFIRIATNATIATDGPHGGRNGAPSPLTPLLHLHYLRRRLWITLTPHHGAWLSSIDVRLIDVRLTLNLKIGAFICCRMKRWRLTLSMNLEIGDANDGDLASLAYFWLVGEEEEQMPKQSRIRHWIGMFVRRNERHELDGALSAFLILSMVQNIKRGEWVYDADDGKGVRL